MNVAILVSVSKYQYQSDMECCYEDAQAINQILVATEKYDLIESFSDVEASGLKTGLRELFSKISSEKIDELLFYFSGHGFLGEEEFFFCCSDFLESKQNETGLSQSELHQHIKSVNPKIAVQIVDACYSGNKIIKSSDSRPIYHVEGFESFLHFASSLDNEVSAPGIPLSPFTAAVRKALFTFDSGPIYYVDVFSKIKDLFLGKKGQTPYFSSQVTGGEVFVDDSKKLEKLKNLLNFQEPEKLENIDINDADQRFPMELSLLGKIKQLDSSKVKREDADLFIGKVFDIFSSAVDSNNSLEGIYEISIVSETDYISGETKNFIVQVMVQQDASDALVSAEITTERKPKRRSRFSTVFDSLYEPEYVENTYHDLDLNCSLNHVQICIHFTPAYQSLSKFKLVVSCVPTLSKCYVFEYLSIHRLNDWDKYEVTGRQVDRRWRSVSWTDGSNLDEVDFFGSYEVKILDHIRNVTSVPTIEK